MWSGLGYYRRASYLHEGAKVVVEKYGGELPGTKSELLSIPGIGEYTAGNKVLVNILFMKLTLIA